MTVTVVHSIEKADEVVLRLPVRIDDSRKGVNVVVVTIVEVFGSVIKVVDVWFNEFLVVVLASEYAKLLV